MYKTPWIIRIYIHVYYTIVHACLPFVLHVEETTMRLVFTHISLTYLQLWCLIAWMHAAARYEGCVKVWMHMQLYFRLSHV